MSAGPGPAWPGSTGSGSVRHGAVIAPLPLPLPLVPGAWPGPGSAVSVPARPLGLPRLSWQGAPRTARARHGTAQPDTAAGPPRAYRRGPARHSRVGSARPRMTMGRPGRQPRPPTRVGYGVPRVRAMEVMASGPTRQQPPMSRAPASRQPSTSPEEKVDRPFQARACASQASPLFG